MRNQSFETKTMKKFSNFDILEKYLSVILKETSIFQVRLDVDRFDHQTIFGDLQAIRYCRSQSIGTQKFSSI